MLPFVETIEMPRGTRLVPVDELRRLLAAERVGRIRVEYAAGKSLRQIALELNTSGTPTAHGGAQWWPSTIRAILRRGA